MRQEQSEIAAVLEELGMDPALIHRMTACDERKVKKQKKTSF